MTTRVTERQVQTTIIGNTLRNRARVAKFSDEVSSGIKAKVPGDTNLAGTIAQYRASLERIEGYQTRIASVTSFLTFQDDILTQVNELLTRAQELAEQGANETNSVTQRAEIAEEVFALRDQLVNLANSTYQGKYIFAGADDDDAPYDNAGYTSPGTGPESQRYVNDGGDGITTTRSVTISDDVSIRVTTRGDQIFDNSIQALERLGRALKGYATSPASGTPDGGGVAYSGAAAFTTQTTDIANTITLLNTARESNIIPERISLGARLKRLLSAQSAIETSKATAQGVLNELQNADPVTSISNLSQAQNALEASLAVTARVLNQSILDFI